MILSATSGFTMESLPLSVPAALDMSQKAFKKIERCKARCDPLLLFLAEATCHSFQHLDVSTACAAGQVAASVSVSTTSRILSNRLKQPQRVRKTAKLLTLKPLLEILQCGSVGLGHCS